MAMTKPTVAQELQDRCVTSLAARIVKEQSGTARIGDRMYRTWGGYLVEEIVDTGFPASEEYQALRKNPRITTMTKLTLLEFLTLDAVCAELSAPKTGRFVAGGVPEQSSHALEIMDRGTAVGRTTAGLNLSGNGMPGADLTEVDSANSGDFSYMAGCLE